MHKAISIFITNLWKKSAAQKRLTFFEKIVFLIFCVFEKIYCAIFFIAQNFNRKNNNKIVPNLKVISVGNLSVGGTGKSVFVGFLVQILGADRCAVISRGYGGTRGSGKSILVSDGQNCFCTPDACGDEPYMLAHTLHVPVIVGKDRYKSCLLLNESFKIAIIDDGYQNHQIKKDLEILLLDARSPFGNGYCLPAGNLREKDCSRADVIILTHADEVSFDYLSQIKHKLLPNFDPRKIFCGRHKPLGLFLSDEEQVALSDYKNKKFLILAAIGSFNGFVQKVKEFGSKNFGIQVDQVLEFPDHHNYSVGDVALIFDTVKKHGLSGVITTQKDWSKLSFLIETDKSFPILIFRITFEFLTVQEDLSFRKTLFEFLPASEYNSYEKILG